MGLDLARLLRLQTAVCSSSFGSFPLFLQVSCFVPLCSCRHHDYKEQIFNDLGENLLIERETAKACIENGILLRKLIGFKPWQNNFVVLFVVR